MIPMNSIPPKILKAIFFGSAIVIVLIALGHMLQRTTVFDDTYISLRTARNWVQFGGPDYNPGIREWVPTNFLWVATLALLHKLAHFDLPRLSQVIGGISGLAIIGLLLLNPLKSIPRVVRFLSAGLCALSPLWAVWPLTGLETSLFSLLLSAGVLYVMKHLEDQKSTSLNIAGIFLGLATLTRPQGLLIFAACWVMLAFSRRVAWKQLGLFFIIFALILLLEVAFLWLGFGSVLPSSYYAKVQGVMNYHAGKQYLKAMFMEYKLIFFFPLLVLPLFEKTQNRYALLIAVLLVWMAWVCLSGGDFMAYYRFVAPVWPLVCLALAIGWRSAWIFFAEKWPGHRSLAATLAVITAFGMAGSFFLPSVMGNDHDRLRAWAKEEADRAKIGKWFGAHYPSRDWIAVKPAGSIPYYSRMNALDFYCITSREAAASAQFIPRNWIGHQKINVDGIMRRLPKVIILDEHLYDLNKLPKADSGDGAIELAWRKNPLRLKYRAIRVPIGNRWLQYFERIMD